MTAWVVGIALLSSYAALRISAEWESRAGVQEFRAARRAALSNAAPSRLTNAAPSRLTNAAPSRLTNAAPSRLRDPSGRVDQSLWSAARVRAFRHTKLQETPEGILRIPALHLVVPIYSGTSASELDRGVGHVEGTAPLDSGGNAAIAGHRDGFFRSLQRVRLGQTLYVETLSTTRRYRVVTTRIVSPSDVAVLSPTALPSITLITCYPFYFVGPAPERFIVRAEILPSRRRAAGRHAADYSKHQE